MAPFEVPLLLYYYDNYYYRHRIFFLCFYYFFAKVWKPHKKLLVGVNRRGIVGDNHRLAHALDTKGVAEAPVRVKLASVCT